MSATHRSAGVATSRPHANRTSWSPWSVSTRSRKPQRSTPSGRARPRCDRVRFLGSYPRAANGRASGAPGTPVIGPSDADGFAAAQSWLERLRAGTTA